MQPLALATLHGEMALVMADPGVGGEVLSRFLGRPMPLREFLPVATSLAECVGRLHGRGLIHRDIKPPHILLNPEMGRAWLAGFGLSLRAPRSRQGPDPPEVIAGTLAYMAPEQTGRVNRSIDSRSDLYSLGVIFYQMLTGSLPFHGETPMDLVHGHVARKPPSPSESVLAVPEAISRIVLKLLAKSGEDRYQTADGLAADLRSCAASLEMVGSVECFELGTSDLSTRLLPPETLYGRDEEIGELLATFDRIAKNGRAEVTLVAGYSGIGKSSVVNELHKALVPPRGLFASGKFDQYKRDIPYATIAEAFRGLVRGILVGPQGDLQRWRESLLASLGTDGRRVTDLIPELERIIGPQPAVPELPPRTAQNLFRRLFRDFIGVFAQPEHPLALFLDDLQWLDAGTLDLLEHLATDETLHHVLIVGAYRDNEVGPEHPLGRRIDAIRRAGTKVREIVLAPLREGDVARLTADTLRCEVERARPLARLIYEKTGGNPFFTIQFIHALGDEQLVVFDRGARAWAWDVERIRAKGFTESVVDLMVAKILRLPAPTLGALQQLACLGTSAPTTSLLLAVDGADESTIHDALAEAVRAGLVYGSAAGYTFLHDRIRQAAYELIAPSERASVHLRLGRLMLARTPSEHLSASSFEIANQLNRGLALMDASSERTALAELNLTAARRARNATAYSSALSYLIVSDSLLPSDRWDTVHDLAFAVAYHRAECELLTGALAAAGERLADLWDRARTIPDLGRVARQRATLYTALDDPARAIEAALSFLRRVGIEWSVTPGPEVVRAELGRVGEQLAGRSIASLVDLPVMTDTTWVTTMEVLVGMMIATMFIAPDLHMLVVGRAANVSLEHGNCEESCLAYIFLGTLLGGHFGDYRAGFEYGQLGLDLLAKHGWTRVEPAAYMVFGISVAPWTQGLRRARLVLERAVSLALKAGDVVSAMYSLSAALGFDVSTGQSLGELHAAAQSALDFMVKARLPGMVPMTMTRINLVRELRGMPTDHGRFGDERGFEQHIEADLRMAVAPCVHWIEKMHRTVVLEDFASALDAETKVRPLIWGIESLFNRAEFHFYGAMARAAQHDELPAEERSGHHDALIAHRDQLARWVKSCDQGTFAPRLALVEAEVERVDGRPWDALRLYERAIGLSREHELVHIEALASKRSAELCELHGLLSSAHAHLRNARYCYQHYEATAIVERLDRRHPKLKFDGPRVSGATDTIEANLDHVDLATVLRVSQVVSREILLDEVVRALMVTAVEHAGAERAVLALMRDGELRIEAEASTERLEVNVVLCQSPVTPSALPESILQFVARTHENVVIDDARQPGEFSADPFFADARGRSVLAVPLLKQSKLIGVLYMENALATHVFTPSRFAMLRVVAAQAATSLDNARLYAGLLKMQSELAHMARVTTLGELAASIAHEVRQPLAAMVFEAGANVRWLGRSPPNIPEALKSAKGIIRQGERANEVVARLRSMFKKREAAKTLVDLNELVRDVIALTRSEVQKHGAEVQTQLAADLPHVLGDRVQLQQVVMNLVLNAGEALVGVDPDAREVWVSTEHRPSGEVLVRVRDSGVGFDSALHERLFESFHTTKPGGLGMGLSISRQIIESHGGRLWAESVPGRGATFQFQLQAGEA